nr:glycosyltransferase [Methanobacterium formicicum]
MIALNNTELSLYEKFGLNKKKVQIIPNGISLVKEDILQKKGLFRIKYQINEDQNIILYLGRIHESKGIDLLIRAFSDLKTSVNKSKLVIVGPDDGFMPKIETLVKKLKIKNDVIFTGPLYGDEKKMAYLDADIFVTPSFTGFPITFLEACSLKKLQ